MPRQPTFFFRIALACLYVLAAAKKGAAPVQVSETTLSAYKLGWE